MKNSKSKGIVVLLVFILALAVGIYTVIYGLGTTTAGKASNIKLGLDLNGGVSITYDIVDEDASASDVQDTIYKLQKRVDRISTEGEVYQAGARRITVEIPNGSSSDDEASIAENANAIFETLGRAGALEFMDQENYEKFAAGEKYETALTGADIKNAEAGIDTSGGGKEYIVQLAFTDEGMSKFAAATEANVGKPIFIVYDGELISYPNVQQKITSQTAQIDGQESFEEADELASTIRIGALPLELETMSQNVVGAKLGQDAVATTLQAGFIGIIVVCVIMLVIYLLPGLVASLALFAYVLLTLLCLNLFDVTLTLPGLAGIVLTIGMAVDANVIIFTRVKEEIALGSSVENSIKAGFNKALSAIIDGNITTLIAAVVLYIMGTGTIKGFAQTLGIGIVLSMFTALFISKMLMKALFGLGLSNPKLYGRARKTKVVNYVKASKFCIIGSLIVIIAGIIFLPINKAKDGNILNFGIEFMGGTSITATFDKPYTLSEAEKEIRPVIAEAGGVNEADIQLQTVEDDNQVVAKLPELDADHKEAVDAALESNFEIVDLSSENISSTISGEMRTDAIIAVAIAAILMLIYIAVRFNDIKFGTSAVIALLHDVLVVFTLYSVCRLSVGNTFIACMLTIVGYSINATIIIFDRIRENMALKDVNRVGLDTIVNESISQTFTRTIYTSLTTFVMVLILYIMGVPAIKDFALTLMAGIVCGAYSSVCITGPIWFILKTKMKKSGNKKVAKKASK